MSSNELSLTQQILVCQQIAQLVRADLPIAGELSRATKGTSKATQNAARIVDDRVSAGESLRGALAGEDTRHSRILGACIEAGERAGCLEETLENWVGFHLDNDRWNRALRNAMLYPITLVVVMLASLGFTIWQLVPEYKETYLLFDQRLPGWLATIVSTRQYTPWLLLILAVLAILPLLLWYRRRWLLDWEGLPREQVVKLRLQSLAAELAERLLKSGQPLADVGDLCSTAVGVQAQVPAQQLFSRQKLIPGLSRETSVLLSSLHAGILPRAEVEQHLHAVAEYLKRAAEQRSIRQVRWLPMLVALSVGVVAGLTYVFLIYLPWILLMRRIVSP